MQEYYIDRKKRLAFPIFSDESNHSAEDENHRFVTFRIHNAGGTSNYVSKMVPTSEILPENSLDVKVYNWEYYQTVRPVRFRFNPNFYTMDRPPSPTPLVIEFNPEITTWPFQRNRAQTIWTFDVPCMEDVFDDFDLMRPKIKVFVNEMRLKGRFRHPLRLLPMVSYVSTPPFHLL